MPPPKQSVPIFTEVTWRRLVGLALYTARADRSLNRPQPRGMTLRRVSRQLSPDLRRAIFLIGSPRSGTTPLGDCLAALPEVSYHFEPVATKNAAYHVYLGEWSMRRSAWFYRNVYKWLMRLRASGDLRFCEKTPRNCLIVPFLASTFEGSQFIHLVRDGRDAALSHAEQPWFSAEVRAPPRREPGGYLFGPHARFWVEPNRRAEFESTTTLHRCIWNWRVYNEHALQGLGELSAARRIQVSYEAIVTNPDLEAARLLDFLEITQSGSRTAFLHAMRAVRPDSMGRWRNQLGTAERMMIEGEAGRLLRLLGYPVTERKVDPSRAETTMVSLFPDSNHDD